ncbi:MAG: glycosyltransferase family 2 protein [Acidobacteriota bacterium]
MRFSIVIPTRNRAPLLAHAIRSALAQTLEDYELVISNNCSTDETESVVKRFGDPRIAYFRTEEALSMVDHWEFALGKVRGDWVLYLCDDDALLPDCLSFLDRMAQQDQDISIIQYANSIYVYDDGITDAGNYLRLKKRSRDLFEIKDSASQLRTVFRTTSGDMPKFLNSAVRMDLVEDIRQHRGRIFYNWVPDYSSGVLLLAHTQRHMVLHEPLMLWGCNVRSYGSGARVDPDHLMNFLREFDQFDGRFPWSPYPDIIVIANMVHDTLCAMRQELGVTQGQLPIDPLRFRRALISDLRIYLEKGHDRFARPLAVVERDLRRMIPGPTRAYKAIRKKMSSGWRRLSGGFRRRREESRIIRGRGTGTRFENISEAADFLWKQGRGRRV